MEFQKGDQVVIKAGPFEGFKGIITDLFPEKGFARVAVLVQFDKLGKRITPVDVEFSHLEKST
jgi:transcription antitermination factor NusG